MSELDNMMRVAIRDIADEVQPRAAFASTALARGRRIRFRRRLRFSLIGVVALVAVAAVPPALLRSTPDQRVDSAAPASDNPTLPPAPGIPGAAQRPELVASDPQLVHFDANLSAIPGLTELTWITDRFSEKLVLLVRANGEANAEMVTVTLTREDAAVDFGSSEPDQTTPTTVAGRPATLERFPVPPPRGDVLHRWHLTWQPADGLDARITTLSRSPDVVTMVAGALRFDRAQRCLLPLQMTGHLVGSKLTSCQVSLRAGAAAAAGGPWVGSAFSVEAPAPIGPMTVQLGAVLPWGFAPNRTVGGKPAMWSDEGHSLSIKGFSAHADLHVQGETEANVTSFISGLHIVDDPQDLSSWPERPIHG